MRVETDEDRPSGPGIESAWLPLNSNRNRSRAILGVVVAVGE